MVGVGVVVPADRHHVTLRNLRVVVKLRPPMSAADPKVCFVVDDVAPPFQPRCVQVRGHGTALEVATWADGTPREAIIRITPSRVVSWGLDS